MSITFDAGDYDESAFSRQVSAHFDTENIEFKCRIDPGDIRKLIYHLEEPMMTLLNLPLWLLSARVRQSGFKVVLSGDGADEILGGYDYFKLMKIMQFIGRRETPRRKSLLRRCYPGLRNEVQTDIQYMLMQDYPVVHPALPYRFQRFGYKKCPVLGRLQRNPGRAAPGQSLHFRYGPHRPPLPARSGPVHRNQDAPVESDPAPGRQDEHGQLGRVAPDFSRPRFGGLRFPNPGTNSKSGA